MAYFTNPDDEEENAQGMNAQAQPDAAPQAGAGPVQLGSQSGSLGGAGKAPAVPKPAASGSGPGFQNYAKANMGIAQGRLNNAAAKNVSNQGQVAKSAIGQATTGFGQRMEAGSLKDMGTAVSDVTNITGAARQVNAAPKPPVAPVAPAPVAAPAVTSPGMAPLAAEDVPANQPVAAAPVAPEAPAPAANPFGTLTDEQTSRFSDVINNKYKGPESLRQAGLYQLASGKVGTAQNTLNQTKTATGREDMLKNMYQQSGNYTTGQNKLDSALLNASKQGVQNVQNAATEQGNVERQLDRAQIDSATQAQNRTNDLLKIKNDAMAAFSSGKKDEEKLTEDRLTEMTTKPVLDAAGKPVMKVDGTPMTEWDRLPESFRSIIANKKENNAAMLKTEMDKVAGTNGDYNAVTKNHAQTKAALDKAKALYEMSSQMGNVNMSGMDGTGGSGITGGGKSDEQFAAHLAGLKSNYDKLQSNYGTLSTQKTEMDALTKKYNPNAVVFNDFEADVLGVNNGEGLYNLGANAIKTEAHENARLVSRDEQARQSVLAQLAGLDNSKRLDTNLNYADADKAGTQSALDALDLDGTRANLNAGEQNFEDTALKTDIKGEGKKKVSRGNALGTTTRTYKASMKGNAGDFLKKSGYDFDAADENADMYGGKDLLNQALQNSQKEDNFDDVESENANAQFAASAKGALSNAYNPWAALVGSVMGNITQSGSWDPGQHVQALADGGLGENNAFSEGHRDIRNHLGAGGKEIGQAIGGPIGGAIGNLGSVVSGIDTKAMAAMGNQVAKANAAADLKKKYSTFLNKEGFENRIGVESNKTTASRAEVLKKLLANMDKTNTQG